MQITTVWAKITNFLATDFVKNVSILSLGSVAGQILLIAISPILTRLYLPQEFGAFATFASIVSILATFSTGKYEFAILIPDNDKEGMEVMMLSATFSIIFSILLALLFSVFPSFWLGFSFFSGGTLWLYLIPASILIVGITSSFIYWLHRKENYKAQSIYQIAYSCINAFFTLVLGVLGYHFWGLEVAYVITMCLSFFVLYYINWKEVRIFLDSNSMEISSLRLVAKKYIDFPKFHILTQLLSNVIQQITPIIFATLYSATVVGYYSLANRILRAPIIVLSQSITSVFRNEALRQIRTEGNCKTSFITTFRRLVILSLPIFIILFLILPPVFGFVFGKEWYEAGIYARLLCGLVFFDFIAIPLTQSIFIIREKQKYNLLLQLLGTLLSILGIFIGYYFFQDVYYSILLFSLGGIIYSIVSLCIGYKVAAIQLA